MKKNTENSKNNAINEDIVRTARRYEECTLSTKETNQQAENCRQQLQQYAKERWHKRQNQYKQIVLPEDDDD